MSHNKGEERSTDKTLHWTGLDWSGCGRTADCLDFSVHSELLANKGKLDLAVPVDEKSRQLKH